MEQIRVVAWARGMRRVHQRLADAPAIARESIEAGQVEEASSGPHDPPTYCWAF